VEVWPAGGSRRAAVLGLLLVPNSMIVHYSVDWWRTLHQSATTASADPTIEGDMLVALMLGMVSGGLVFVWLLIHRFRLAWLQQRVEQHELDAAVEARLAEARADVETPAGSTSTSTSATSTVSTSEPTVEAPA
jgi:cytoskeletal protein RodZ